jgi:hypothetical protein
MLRRLALLLVPLALVACATPGPSVVSLPPRVGPSGLLIRLDYGWKGFGIGRHNADYLTDGTVIRWNGTGCGAYGQPCGTLEQNTLTASGLTAFRALLTQDADLLGAPMVVASQTAPGTHPINHQDDMADTFVLERADGTRYTVEVPSTTSRDAGTWVQDPAITRLNVLAEAMLDPATVVGAGGLASPTWTPYKPSAAAVVVTPGTVVTPVPVDSPFGTDIQKTGWPFGGTPDTFGATFAPNPSDTYLLSKNGSRCAFLDNVATVEAFDHLPRAVGTSLVAPDLASGAHWGAGPMLWGDHLRFGMWATTLLPEDVAGSCADAFTY